jgi:hypothetical protein
LSGRHDAEIEISEGPEPPREGPCISGLTAKPDRLVELGLKAKGNEPVRVASGHHANDDKSPLMASAKKPNKEIPKTRNK